MAVMLTLTLMLLLLAVAAPGSNILMHAGNLRITDFGFMTTVEAARQRQQSEIVTLWYRSPELLLGTTSYGQEVDIWSAGCALLPAPSFSSSRIPHYHLLGATGASSLNF